MINQIAPLKIYWIFCVDKVERVHMYLFSVSEFEIEAETNHFGESKLIFLNDLQARDHTLGSNMLYFLKKQTVFSAVKQSFNTSP